MNQGMAAGAGNYKVSGFGYADYGSNLAHCSNKTLVQSQIIIYYVSCGELITHSGIHSKWDGFVKPYVEGGVVNEPGIWISVPMR